MQDADTFRFPTPGFSGEVHKLRLWGGSNYRAAQIREFCTDEGKKNLSVLRLCFKFFSQSFGEMIT